MTVAIVEADEVELDLTAEQVFLVLGDFQAPNNSRCARVVGVSVRFPIEQPPAVHRFGHGLRSPSLRAARRRKPSRNERNKQQEKDIKHTLAL